MLRCIIFFIFMSCLALPTAVTATTASEAISHISSAQTMEAGGRKLYMGGSMTMRVPTKNYNLVSVTPPSFSAGCGGIDAHLGGFSHINADKFKEMVDNIINSSKGYAVDLAIRTLCPLCMDILQKLRDVANWANNLSVDSCAAAQTLVNSAADAAQGAGGMASGAGQWLADESGFSGSSVDTWMSGMASSAGKWMDTCATEAMNSGETNSRGEAERGMCGDVASAISDAAEGINDGIDAVNSGESFFALEQPDRQKILDSGNQTYIGLVSAGITDVEIINLIMSALGTSYWQMEVPTSSQQPPLRQVQGWADKVKAKSAGEMLAAILVYGDGVQDQYNLSQKFKQLKDQSSSNDSQYPGVRNTEFDGYDITKISELPYIYCNDIGESGTLDGDASDYTKCRGEDIVESTVGDSDNPYMTEGIAPYIQSKLLDAAKNIAKGQPIKDDEVLKIANLAPIPVHKILKISAVYPAEGQRMIKAYGEFIGLMIAEAQFNAILGDIDRPRDAQIPKSAEKMQKAISASLNQISNDLDEKKEEFFTSLSRRTAIMAQIDKAERIIAERAIVSGAAGSAIFSRTLRSSGMGASMGGNQ